MDELQAASLDELLDQVHSAHAVWQAICQMELSRLLNTVRAVEGHFGRDATDPRILVALWIYATLQAVASARALAKLHEAKEKIETLASLSYEQPEELSARQPAARQREANQREDLNTADLQHC